MNIPSKRQIKYYKLVWLKHDLAAGLAVFLVALPLCMGIALASGAPLYSGILSGIIGGLIVSFISGSQLSVSGPAAGLTTIVAASIISLGDYKVFLLSVIVAGIFQIILGLLKLGTIANYFPSAVIKGMLAAIGIILIAKQIPVAVGYDKPDFWRSGFLNMFSSGKPLISNGVVLISLLSIIILVIMQRPKFKSYKVIPAPLVVVVIGALLSFAFMHYVQPLALKPTQLVTIPANIFQSISFPDFSKIFNAEIIKDGVIIGMLASLETLLCVEAIDKLDEHDRITPVNRELVAQGIGNTLCGLLGAIPMTAVIIRGAANVDSGGRSKMSAFTHGLFLLLAVLFIPFLLSMIPYASLAAILLITGYNLTKPKLYRSMWKLGWQQFLPFIITIIIILMTDLLIGVSIGLVLATYFIIRNNFKAEYIIQETKQGPLDVFYLKLNSNVTFLNKVNLRDTLDKVPRSSVLTIDGSECNFIDYDVLEIISEYKEKAQDRKILLNLKGIQEVNVSAIH